MIAALKKKSYFKATGILLLILGCFIFTYTASRAYFMSITTDEVYTYFCFVRKTILLPFKIDMLSTNNHLLNTWLTIISVYFFGNSEFALRIPNLAGHLLFLFYSAKLVNTFSLRSVSISAFLILNLNPYILDFFSLSRGYGLSNGLLAGSIWYLYLFLNNNLRHRYSLLSLIFGMLSVLACAPLIHYIILLFIIILITDFLFFNNEKNGISKLFYTLNKNLISEILFFGFLLLISWVLIRLYKAEVLVFGGSTSFFKDTYLAVFEATLYEKGYPIILKSLLIGLSFVVVIVTLFVSMKGLYLKNLTPNTIFLPILFILLVSCSLASILQHYILDLKYPTYRFALYFLVIFNFMFVFLLNELSKSFRVIKYILPVIVFATVLHFINCYNLKYVLEWKWDADVKEMVYDIDALKNETPPEKFNTDVGMNFEFEQPFNYYRYVNDLTWLNIAGGDGYKKFSPLCEFYLYFENDLNKNNADSFDIIKTYPLNQNKLLRRKYNPKNYKVCFEEKINFDKNNDTIREHNKHSINYSYNGTKSGITNKTNEISEAVNYKIDLSKTPVKNSMIIVKAMVRLNQLDNPDAGLAISFKNNERIYSWQKSNISNYANVHKHGSRYFSLVTYLNQQNKEICCLYIYQIKTAKYILTILK